MAARGTSFAACQAGEISQRAAKPPPWDCGKTAAASLLHSIKAGLPNAEHMV
jgi:hypothetical protein